jgi:hypothetical protein
VLRQATNKLELTRLTTAQTWRKPPLSPLIIYFVPLHEAHIQMTFCPETRKWEFQNSQLGLPRLWGPISLCEKLWLKWGQQQSYSPCRRLFNNMSHDTWTWGNLGDSWLLMVENQIANLTLDHSFGPNLHFRCPNGSCEPILDIFIPKSFQWYKELFNALSFDPYDRLLKIQESTGTPTPKVETPFGSVRVHPLTLSYTPKSMRCDSQASLLACNLASPYLGRKPKARVTTMWRIIIS